MFLYQTGMRQAELRGLKDADISESAMQLKVRGKRNKERIIPISAEMLKMIEGYKIVRDEQFPGRDNVMLLVDDRGKAMSPTFGPDHLMIMYLPQRFCTVKGLYTGRATNRYFESQLPYLSQLTGQNFPQSDEKGTTSEVAGAKPTYVTIHVPHYDDGLDDDDDEEDADLRLYGGMYSD